MSGDVNAWMHALYDRHVRPMGQPAFLKAVRALSVRYVERRRQLHHRSPIDSAGKRAAFAGFFAPLHFVTTAAIVADLEFGQLPIETIVDLGCGTGAAGGAWAMALPTAPALLGVDVNSWSVDETNWTWRALGLRGRARRGDLVKTCVRLREPGRRSTAIVLGWVVNELDPAVRDVLLPQLVELGRGGTAILVIEPAARSVTAPWWDRWAGAFAEAQGLAREWHFTVPLPERLAQLDRAAGFRREELSARSLSLRGST